MKKENNEFKEVNYLIDYFNKRELSYAQIMALMETTKMLIFQQTMNRILGDMDGKEKTNK